MKTSIIALAAALLTGSAFSADYLTTSDSAPTGVNNTLTMYYETTFNLVGNGLKVGDFLPGTKLTSQALSEYNTSDNNEKVRIFSVLASVDTPVCNQQARELSNFVDNNVTLLKDIEFIALSADTPFAQQRFIQTEKISEKLTFLSDSKNHSFGMESGTQISELGLLARSIFVVDKQNKIVHIQRVPELTMIPDLSKAVEVAKSQI